MGNTNLLKPYLELCRRLGVRYVSLSRATSGLKTGPMAPAKIKNNVTRVSEASPIKVVGVPSPSGRPRWMTASEDSIQAMELMAFEKDICECQKCPLGKTRKNFVFGSGDPQAKVVFVGEAPGGEEDVQGLPFVGEAGKLLTKIIESTKLWKRSEVFICNILKCRPPNNRTPSPEEMEKCRPYLEEQIQILKPKFIMAMGATAAQTLLNTTTSVGKLRNKWHDYRGIPLRYLPSGGASQVRGLQKRRMGRHQGIEQEIHRGNPNILKFLPRFLPHEIMPPKT
jgi:uracil-DNA glycosylase family 4